MSAIVRSPCAAVNVATQRTLYKQTAQGASITDYPTYSKYALALLARSAPERLVGGANVRSPGAAEFVNPEHIVDVVCQLAESLLAFPLCLLGPMALSDIPEDDDNTLDLAV